MGHNNTATHNISILYVLSKLPEVVLKEKNVLWISL